MTEELVTFETAKLAKAKGFDEDCMNYWEWYPWKPSMKAIAHAKPIMDFREVNFGLVKAAQERPGLFNLIYQPMRNSSTKIWLFARPTQSLLKRWLLEIHNLNVNTYPELGKWEVNVYSFTEKDCLYHSGKEDAQDTYESGDELGLKEALKRIK